MWLPARRHDADYHRVATKIDGEGHARTILALVDVAVVALLDDDPLRV